MSEYNPEEYLEGLQALLNELEEELEDRLLPTADLNRLKQQRKSVKEQIKQVKAEIKAMKQLDAPTVAAYNSYQAAIENHHEVRQDVPHPHDQPLDADIEALFADHAEDVKTALRARTEARKQLQERGFAPGQVHMDRSKPPTDYWLAELVLFGGAHGWTLAETCDRVDALGAWTWDVYDTVRGVISKSPRGKSLDAKQLGLLEVENVVAETDTMFADEATEDLFADETTNNNVQGATAPEGKAFTADELLIVDQCKAALGFNPPDAIETEEQADAVLEGYCTLLDKIERRKAAHQSWLSEYSSYQRLIEEHYLPAVQHWLQQGNLDPGKQSKKFASCMAQLRTYEDTFEVGDKDKLLEALAKLPAEEAAALQVSKKKVTVEEVKYADIKLLKAHALKTGDIFGGGLKRVDKHTEMTIKRGK